MIFSFHEALKDKSGCEICSKLTKSSKQSHWHENIKIHWWRSDTFIVNFELILFLFLVFHSWIWESVAGWVYQRQSNAKDLNIMKHASAGSKLCSINQTGQTATWNKTCIEFQTYAEKDFEQLSMKWNEFIS